jgi:hypothetical protein
MLGPRLELVPDHESVMLTAEHVSGAENGAERVEKQVGGSGAVSGTFEKERSGSGAGDRGTGTER